MATQQQNTSNNNPIDQNTPEFQDASSIFQTTSANQIHRVSVKPAPFIKSAPKLYFMQMEAQFLLSGITTDSTKFNHILGSLDPQFLQPVIDVIENPSLTNKYETLKTRILAEFTHSDQHKLRILLKETELGDAKPSQLLRKMRELSNNALSDEALKTLWIERLPEQIRPVISTADGDLNKIASMADKILEITTFRQISEVAVSNNRHKNSDEMSPQIAALAKQIEELSKKVSHFSSDRGRSQSLSGSSHRNRSSSKSKSDKPYCFYHFKFGAMAQKCVDPCKFKTENKMADNKQKN